MLELKLTSHVDHIKAMEVDATDQLDQLKQTSETLKVSVFKISNKLVSTFSFFFNITWILNMHNGVKGYWYDF